MLITNINNAHFRLGYYNNNSPIDLNYVFNSNNILDNEKIIINKEIDSDNNN